jgi:hypothetical protein
MKIQINKERSVELSELTEKDALIWASAVYLGTSFPDNYDEMTKEDFDTFKTLSEGFQKTLRFIEENCVEEHEYASAQDIYQKIDDLAWYLLHSIKK